MKKIPQKFYKLSMEQQEVYLIDMLKAVHEDEKEIKRMLAAVRGGYHYEVTTEPDRPDLMTMKLGEGV